MADKYTALVWQDELIRIDYNRRLRMHIVTAKDTGEELVLGSNETSARRVSCVYHDMVQQNRRQSLEWCEQYI